MPTQPRDQRRRASTGRHPDELVVLLHGLRRTPRSMRPLQLRLEAEGYRVLAQAYPSTRGPIEHLAARLATALQPAMASARAVHFVTHSMGGILVRQLRAAGALPRLSRVVMLAPPNQGSEVVDRLGHLTLFQWLNGPAGNQLGTGAASTPNALPPADFELGIIAGRRSSPLAWLLSLWGPVFDGENDGKVAVARTRLEGMRDFLVVDHTHTWLMGRPDVQRAVVHFLATGSFAPAA